MSKQQEFFGEHGIRDLQKIVTERGAEEVLLITGQKSFVNQSYAKDIFKALSKSRVQHYIFAESNPTTEHIEQCLQSAQRPYDLLICIGGGSVIDLGKLVKSELSSSLAMIAIPTTTGTGSESTQFATYYKSGVKQSRDQENLLPDYCILDPVFVRALPRMVSIHTGLDAVCQAMESFWSCRATDESREYAAEAMKLWKAYFMEYIEIRNNENSLAMLKMANLAGKAIQITRTTAAHALSYKLTWDLNIPHGLAVALCLPGVFEFNSQVTEESCAHPQGMKRVQGDILQIKKYFGLRPQDSMTDAFHSLFERMGLSFHLQEYGLTPDKLKDFAESAFLSNRKDNNPRRMNVQEAIQILEKSL